jgi:hypothetical protein
LRDPAPLARWHGPCPLGNVMCWSLWKRWAALLALVAAGSVARAQEHPEPGGLAPEGRPSYQTATGALTAYDPLTRVLTVRSAAGLSELHVASDARLWLGTRRLPLSQLGAYAGAQVTVAWSERDGVRTTHTVRVTDTRAAKGK